MSSDDEFVVDFVGNASKNVKEMWSKVERGRKRRHSHSSTSSAVLPQCPGLAGAATGRAAESAVGSSSRPVQIEQAVVKIVVNHKSKVDQPARQETPQAATHPAPGHQQEEPARPEESDQAMYKSGGRRQQVKGEAGCSVIGLSQPAAVLGS